MTSFAFSATNNAPVSVTFSLEPARNALLSMALLNGGPLARGADAWVAQTAAQLAEAQKLRNRLVFQRFGNALLAVKDAPDFPAYLDALARAHPAQLRELARACPPALPADLAREAAPFEQDASALRAMLVAHLRDLWQSHVQAEWARKQTQLSGLVSAMKHHAAAPEGNAADVARAITKQPLPDWALAQLEGAQKIVLALSPHARLFVDRFGSPDTAWVFARFDAAMLRQSPITRAEALGPLTALADDTRLHLLQILAAGGELRGQDILAQMDVSQPNVSRHLKQLVGAGFVDERRAGDTNKWYRLNPDGLNELTEKLRQLLDANTAQASLSQQKAQTARNTALAAYPIALRPFLDEEGRVAHFSTKLKEQKLVLAYLITKFETGKSYTEKEATQLIDRWVKPGQGRFGVDAVTLRRALVEESNLRRTETGSKYWIEELGVGR
ncbi:MAG TPA: metalloregulator ArsR/SmtB family transcription factor [Thermoflexales bacterium]|nr:metalloregulator ArsR/SmtB family transcription factor [Thermoflexales bacterium]HQW35738.1 metalloregulator ArsR/SmtB family transcription factor [Thermoflexales bacterium]